MTSKKSFPTISDKPVITRFAPSPNGFLHVGHAYSALHCWQVAEQLGGHCLVRIEDIDTGRCRPHFEDAIFEVLRWLNLPYQTPVLRQSDCFTDYAKAINTLDNMGLLYPCFASRKEIIASYGDNPPSEINNGVDGLIYSGMHRNLSSDEIANRKAQGEPYCLRLKMDEAYKLAVEKHKNAHNGADLTFTDIKYGTHQVNIENCGDIVIKRKDTPTSYHLSVVWDDARQNITHVTRGHDLWQATHIHRILQVLLDLLEPKYSHHPLVLDSNEKRHAKSRGSESILDIKNRGISGEEFLSELKKYKLNQIIV